MAAQVLQQEQSMHARQLSFVTPIRSGWRRAWQLLGGALLVCASMHHGLSQAQTVTQPICSINTIEVRVDDSLKMRPIGRDLLVKEDESGRLTLDQAQATCMGWKVNSHNAIQNGISHSAWWVRLKVRNTSSNALKVFLDTQDSLQDYVDAYVLDGPGKVKHRWFTGDRRPFEQRPIPDSAVVLPLDMPAGATIEVVIRLAAYDGLHEVLAPVLRSEDNFTRHAQQRTFVNALFVGVVAALILYNAFMYMGAWVRMVGLYAFYVTVFLAWSMAFYGISFQYFWPNHPDFNNNWIAISACLAHCTGFYFFVRYMGKAAPGTEKICFWANAIFTVLLAIPTALAFAGKYAATFIVLIPVNFLMVSFVFVWAFMQWRRGNNMGKFVLLAFTALGAGVVLYFTRALGWSDSNVINENGIQIGSILEVLLVAFGVADQLNDIQKAKLEAERQALKAQKTLNDELDDLVKERTHSLEQANSQLRTLNVTDPLTQIHNRRHFDDTLKQLLQQRNVDGASFALSIFDIDHFKWINDHLGHQAGDDVLIAVAQTAQRVAAEHGASVFRIGGEEFAILFAPGTDSSQSIQTVESVRQAIENLNLPHDGSTHGKVTASFGVIAYGQGHVLSAHPAEHPCAQADALLYAAKHAGRNRLHSDIFSARQANTQPSGRMPTSTGWHETDAGALA